MRYAYFGFGMLLFGSIGLVIIVMMQSVTINNDSEYYNLKEAMQAAMLESVDYVCYRVDGKAVASIEDNDCGYLLKISEQKFVDNFTRRFIATVGGDATKYKLEFYDIIESPPKASVAIKANTTSYGIVSQNEELTITNSLSGILELKKGIIDKYAYFESVKVDNSVTTSDEGFSSIASKPSDVDISSSSAADADSDGNSFCDKNPGDDSCKSESISDETEIDDGEEFDALDDEDKNDESDESKTDE